MEEQLRQAQKLEAIGQLTGGIAHDFNNILAIVMGNIERATLGIDKPDRALGALANAMEASQRAAGLTEQLLAFARKQPLQVQRHDLSHIAEELVRLIALTLGEHIVLVTQLSKAPLPVDIDRQQLEAALINLAVNARDAMPDGGTLTITTDEVDQGEVLIMVSDSGTGMDSRTLERATEPFFTTKPVGRGSGLGLSQVYGFVQEAGGRLTIASAPGEGSRVTITLARGQSGAWT
jgi:signal transduction histidine kinase